MCCSLAAAALIRPLAWKLPYAISASLKRQKKRGRKEKNFKVYVYLKHLRIHCSPKLNCQLRAYPFLSSTLPFYVTPWTVFLIERNNKNQKRRFSSYFTVNIYPHWKFGKYTNMSRIKRKASWSSYCGSAVNKSHQHPWEHRFDPWPCSVGSGSGVAMRGGVRHRHASDPALLWLWCRPASSCSSNSTPSLGGP